MKMSSALLIIAVMGGAGWYGYTRWYSKPSPATAAPARPIFPAEHVLTDRAGRTMPARLLARDASVVRFVRTSDGTSYDYPIGSLSDDDQRFVRQFPESRLDQLVASPAGPGKPPAESPAVSRLRIERAELEHRIALMNLELQKQDNKTPTLPRDEIQQRMRDCRNRIIDIDKELLEIAFRSRGN
jgi:hypothetical protein